MIVCIWLMGGKESLKKEHSLLNHHTFKVTQHLFTFHWWELVTWLHLSASSLEIVVPGWVVTVLNGFEHMLMHMSHSIFLGKGVMCILYLPVFLTCPSQSTERGFKNIQVSKSHSSIARNAFQLTFQIFICKWAPKAYCCVFWRIQNILKRFLFTLLMGTFLSL